MRDRKRSPRAAGRGAAAAELTFCLPLLLVLALGCVDFGRFAYTYIAAVNSARAGAAFGSVTPYTTPTSANWQAAIKQAATDEWSNIAGFDANQLRVTSRATQEASGDWRVQVNASYPFRTLVPWPGVPSSLTLSDQCVLRIVR